MLFPLQANMATSALFGREGNRSYDLEADLEAPAEEGDSLIL